MRSDRWWLAAGAAVAGLGAQAAMAQSSMTLYGIVDSGVEFLTHANSKGDSLVRVPSITGTVPSRWGIRGTDNLGNGYAAVFTLESGFNVGKGDMGQGGRLFGRQAFVGVKTPYGTITLGRQYSASNSVISDSNVTGPILYKFGSTDSYLSNARADNSIKYLGKAYGFTFMGQYSFARDSTGTGNSPGQGTCVGGAGTGIACKAWSVMLRYDEPRHYGVALSYEQQRGGAGAMANLYNGLPAISLSSASDKDVRINVNGWAMLGPVKVGGGWLGRRVTTTARDVNVDTYYLTAKYPVTYTFDVEGAVFRVINDQMDTRATGLAAIVLYHLSKRTAIYAQSGYIMNSRHAQYTISSGGGGSNPAGGMNQLGVMLGVRHNF